MSTKYKFYNPDGIYFVSFATVYWIDVFTRNDYRNITLESLRHCKEQKGLNIHAYVIMTNHIHLIVSRSGEKKLEEIIRDFKKFTAFKIIGSIMDNIQESRKGWLLKLFEHAGKRNSNNTQYQFWQQDNHPIELTDNKIIDQKLEYIHQNPVEAGFVKQARDYLYSSAGDYCGEKGLIEIKLLE